MPPISKKMLTILRQEPLLDRYQQCERKIGFSTHHKAAMEAKRLEAKNGEKMQAYECPHCQKWHVGHKLK